MSSNTENMNGEGSNNVPADISNNNASGSGPASSSSHPPPTWAQKGKWKQPTVSSACSSDSDSKYSTHVPSAAISSPAHPNSGYAELTSGSEDEDQSMAEDEDESYLLSPSPSPTGILGPPQHSDPWSSGSETANENDSVRVPEYMNEGFIMPPPSLNRQDADLASPDDRPVPPFNSPHDDVPPAFMHTRVTQGSHPDDVWIPQVYFNDTRPCRKVVRAPNGTLWYADQLELRNRSGHEVEQIPVRRCPYGEPVTASEGGTSVGGSSRNAGANEPLIVFMPHFSIVENRLRTEEESQRARDELYGCEFYQKKVRDELYDSTPSQPSPTSANFDAVEKNEEVAKYVNEPTQPRRMMNHFEETKRKLEALKIALAEEEGGYEGDCEKGKKCAGPEVHKYAFGLQEKAESSKDAARRLAYKHKPNPTLGTDLPYDSVSSSSSSSSCYSTSSGSTAKPDPYADHPSSAPRATPPTVAPTPHLTAYNAEPLPCHFQAHFAHVTANFQLAYTNAFLSNWSERAAVMHEMDTSISPVHRQMALAHYIDRCHAWYTWALRQHAGVIETLSFAMERGVHLWALSGLVAEWLRFAHHLVESIEYCGEALKVEELREEIAAAGCDIAKALYGLPIVDKRSTTKDAEQRTTTSAKSRYFVPSDCQYSRGHFGVSEDTESDTACKRYSTIPIELDTVGTVYFSCSKCHRHLKVEGGAKGKVVIQNRIGAETGPTLIVDVYGPDGKWIQGDHSLVRTVLISKSGGDRVLIKASELIGEGRRHMCPRMKPGRRWVMVEEP